jgi:membrane fusion protein, multidrug efflux system
MMRWPFLTLAFAVPAAAENAAPVMETPPRPVMSEVVAPSGELSVSFIGTVAAKVEVDLGFPMGGTIAARPVERADVVARDEVLAHLDPEELEADMRAADAGVAVARAQMNSARDARDRARELVTRGVGAQTRLDDAERALVAAEARLKQAEAAQARAADMAALATLKAPWDGVVTTIYQEPGASLSAGQPVLQLSGTAEREIVIDLSETDAAAARPGQEFMARLVANGAVSAKAVLDRIDPVAERSTRTRRAHLVLQTAPAAFRLGALAKVSPVVGEKSAIVLPIGAVLDPDAAPAVWIVDRAANSVRRTPVALGVRFRDIVLVTSGLNPGDEVVTRGIHSLQDGQIVGPRITE